MAEGTLTNYIRRLVAKAEPYTPQIPKPKKKIPLQTKLLWCGACVVIYMVTVSYTHLTLPTNREV